MIRALIAQDWMSFGVKISIVMTDGDGDRPVRIRRTGGAGGAWEQLSDVPVIVEPTMTLNDDEARALLDALTRHYQGASDMHTTRADLLHERGRVDKLTAAVIDIAERAAT